VTLSWNNLYRQGLQASADADAPVLVADS